MFDNSKVQRITALLERLTEEYDEVYILPEETFSENELALEILLTNFKDRIEFNDEKEYLIEKISQLSSFELKNTTPEPKVEAKQLNAADFFASANAGSFNQPRRTSMPEVSPSFTNIEIPDFLKK